LLDAEITQLERTLAGDPAALEGQSRLLAERMTLALQAAILIRTGDAAISDIFCQSRLGARHGLAFGTLPASAPIAHLLERIWPG
jgi:putative acyl-CoA dehydrogenase